MDHRRLNLEKHGELGLIFLYYHVPDMLVSLFMSRHCRFLISLLPLLHSSPCLTCLSAFIVM